MKLIFCIQFFGRVGGAETQLLNLLPLFDQNKIRYEIIYQSLKVSRSRVKLLIYLYKIVKKMIFCKSRKTIFYFLGGGVEKILFYLVNKLTKRIKYVVKITGTFDKRVQDMYDRWIRTRIDKKILHKFLKGADFLIVQDRRSVDVLVNKYKFVRKKIVIIPNGVKVKKNNREIKEIKKIMFAGRLLKEKGIYEIVEVAKRAQGEFNFVICGDGPELNKLKEMVEEQNIRNVMLKGYVKKLEAIYMASDLLLLPSYREGFPNVILEAMSYKLPVVSTKCGALPEYFEDKKHIFFIEDFYPETIIDKLNYLKKNLELVNQVKDCAYNFVKEKFSLENSFNKHIEIFESLIK